MAGYSDIDQTNRSPRTKTVLPPKEHIFELVSLAPQDAVGGGAQKRKPSSASSTIRMTVVSVAT